MRDAGFTLSEPRPGAEEPGVWVASARIDGQMVLIPIDLIVPEGVAPPGGRRGAPRCARQQGSKTRGRARGGTGGSQHDAPDIPRPERYAATRRGGRRPRGARRCEGSQDPRPSRTAGSSHRQGCGGCLPSHAIDEIRRRRGNIAPPCRVRHGRSTDPGRNRFSARPVREPARTRDRHSGARAQDRDAGSARDRSVRRLDDARARRALSPGRRPRRCQIRGRGSWWHAITSNLPVSRALNACGTMHSGAWGTADSSQRQGDRPNRRASSRS